MLESTEIKRLLQAHHAELTRWLALDISSHSELLNAVASGKHDSEEDRDSLHDDVSDAYDLISAMLLSNAWNGDAVNDEFWDTEMGRVLLNVKVWLDFDELITIKEAAEIARGSSETRDLVWINSQIKNGKLDRYTDLNEPNPQRASRVSRMQVERLKK